MKMSKTYIAYNTNVIVKDIAIDGLYSKGGILIEQYDMSRSEGIIEDIGPNAFDDFGDRRPAVGDRIVYARYAGKELGVYSDGAPRRIMRDLDVLCKVVEEEISTSVGGC